MKYTPNPAISHAEEEMRRSLFGLPATHKAPPDPRARKPAPITLPKLTSSWLAEMLQ